MTTAESIARFKGSLNRGPTRGREAPWVELGATGVWPRVEGQVYSADMVERPKPAPDLFLHAARS